MMIQCKFVADRDTLLSLLAGLLEGQVSFYEDEQFPFNLKTTNKVYRQYTSVEAYKKVLAWPESATCTILLVGNDVKVCLGSGEGK